MKLLQRTILLLTFILIINEAKACHALALLNVQSNPIAGGIRVTASSDPVTCGCDDYWLDVEVRCMGEPFDGAPFNPGFHGPLNTYPYFQSARMQKPDCELKQYPWVTIPYTSLCPGIQYQVRMRENHNGLVGPWTTPLTFTVPGTSTPLDVDINATNASVCVGACTTLSADVVGGCELSLVYNWSNGGTGSSINVCPTVTTTYTVTVTELCSNLTQTESFTVQVLPTPVAGVAAANPSVVCIGETTNLTLTGHSGNIQWQSAPNAGGPWTNIPGATAVNQTSAPINNDICFRAEVSGCGPATYSNAVCVTVEARPNLTVNNQTICNGQTATLISTVDLPGGDYLWTPTNQTTANLIGVAPTETTTYTLSYTLNDCTVEASGVITVNPLPVSSFTFTEVCEDASTTLTSTSTVGGTATINGYEWDITNNNTVDYTTQNVSHNFNGHGAHTVNLKVTTDQGCTDEITQTINVFPLPLIDFDADPLCLGDPTSFTDLTTVPNAGTISNWDWNFDDGNTGNTQNPQNTYATAGVYNVSLEITTNNGCTDQLTKQVEIFQLPTADFNFTNACFYDAITFQNTSTANATLFEWNFGDGTAINTNENPSYTYANPGVYDVELTVSTTNGCEGVINHTVTAYAQPNASFNVAPVCYGNSSVYNDASTVVDIDGDIITGWNWNFGDGNSSNSATPTNQYGSENVYSTTLTVTSNYGCQHSYTANTVVWPLPVVNFSPTDVCLEFPTQFQDLSTVSNQYTNNSLASWNWDFSDGNTASVKNPTHTYAADGTYLVNLEVTTNNGCVKDSNILVTVHPKPVANFDGSDIEGCSPVCFNLNSTSTVNSTATISNYEWRLSNGVSHSSSSPTWGDCIVNTLGTTTSYGVELTITTNHGCVDTHTESNYINVYHNPTASFTYLPTEIDVMDPVIKITNNSLYADNYNWTIYGYGTSSEFEPEFEFEPVPQTHEIMLVASTHEGCVDTVYSSVKVNDRVIIYVPNTFTPDGDNFNEMFQPQFTSGFDPYNYNLKIFNRWGEIIFESNNAEIGWDGSYGTKNNEPIKTGTYLWKIEFKESDKDKRHVLEGHVNLLR